MIESIADKLTKIVVTISENNFVNDLPKYPIIDPNNGKKIIAYSI